MTRTDALMANQTKTPAAAHSYCSAAANDNQVYLMIAFDVQH